MQVELSIGEKFIKVETGKVKYWIRLSSIDVLSVQPYLAEEETVLKIGRKGGDSCIFLEFDSEEKALRFVEVLMPHILAAE